jgi:hypothetical protein
MNQKEQEQHDIASLRKSRLQMLRDTKRRREEEFHSSKSLFSSREKHRLHQSNHHHHQNHHHPGDGTPISPSTSIDSGDNSTVATMRSKSTLASVTSTPHDVDADALRWHHRQLRCHHDQLKFLFS